MLSWHASIGSSSPAVLIPQQYVALPHGIATCVQPYRYLESLLNTYFG